MRTIKLILLWLVGCVATQIRCVNFYGIENERGSPVCDWQHAPEWYLKQLQSGFGLNAVRLPYSRDYVMGNHFEKMDAFIQTCQKLGLMVILDYHRTYCTHQGKTPTEGITLGQFLDTHLALLKRYGNKIWGVSIFNEIQVVDSAYTNRINHMAVNAIESQYPGMYTYFLGCAKWGHDCSGITLPVGFENRSYIDIHQYSFTDNATERATVFPDRIPSERYFVGEIGGKHEDMPWLQSYLGYLEKRNITNLCFWTIAQSADTGGLWKDDCETVEHEKIELLARFFNHSNSLPVPPCRRLRGGKRHFEF